MPRAPPSKRVGGITYKLIILDNRRAVKFRNTNLLESCLNTGFHRAKFNNDCNHVVITTTGSPIIRRSEKESSPLTALSFSPCS